MDALLPVVRSIGGGSDVHQKTLTACRLKTGASGEALAQRRVFRTVTTALQERAAWLAQEGGRQVAIERTGGYWKPVYNILEKAGLEVVLVNAQPVQNVPGRKTDVKDAEGLATRLRVALLRSSLVPPQAMRELPDLTRSRTQLSRPRADACNRIQKLLENGTSKRARGASNGLGASGRDMLQARTEGVDSPKALANRARGRLRDPLPELAEALGGVMRETQRWRRREPFHKVRERDEAMLRLDGTIAERCLPFTPARAILDHIPGVKQRIAQGIVAAIGLDRSRFTWATPLASWAGMCPGNHASAGKQKRGTVRKGHRGLRQALVAAAGAASDSTDTSLSATFHRLKGRRGGKRAGRAVGRRILRRAHALRSNPRP